MLLRPRVLLTSLIIAVPAALLMTWAVERVRASDREVALERVVRSQINAQVRERCESDPTWFLTGPLEGRPPGGVFVESGDTLPPRPRVSPQPFELFAYDEALIGSSPATPRLPADIRRQLRSLSDVVVAPYVSENGTGVQVAMPTGWIGGPCMYFLGRLEPPPHQQRQRALFFFGFLAVSFGVAWLAATPVVRRVRRLARDAHEGVAAGYASIGPDKVRDELNSLTFVYNDAATELHQRETRIEDQDVAMKRLLEAAEEDVAGPLSALETELGALARGAGGRSDEAVRHALIRAHDLTTAVENLTAANRLRFLPAEPPVVRVDLTAIVARVIARHAPLAEARGVTLESAARAEALSIEADARFVERAVANVVDNAIRYNVAGGRVTVGLARIEGEHRFRLWVTDTGPGVSDEAFRGLTAIRRFRGDEARNRRPDAPGLGLAIVREVSERFGFQLDLKRPGAGGFEVELSGPIA